MTDTPTVEQMVRKIASGLMGWSDTGISASDGAVFVGDIDAYFQPHLDTPEGAADRERVMLKAPRIAVRHVVHDDGTHLCGLVDTDTHNPQKSWWGSGDTWGRAFVKAWDNYLNDAKIHSLKS